MATATSLNYLVEETGAFTARTEGLYARCVQDTAQAVLGMTKIKPDSVRDIAAARPIHDTLARHHKFIAFNLDPLKGCAECDSLTEEEQVFGSKGTLPLLALILGITHFPDGPIGDLKLITSAWGSGQQPVRAGSHCTLTLTTQNRLLPVIRHQPYLGDDYGQKTPLEALAFVEYLHGINPSIGDERAEHDEGSLELLGFPGAADYVTAQLTRLPIYLRQLASRLQCSHTAQ